MAKIKFRVEGMEKLQNNLKKLGEVPQKYVTASAKKGMNIVKKDAKADSPYLTGNLEKGIVLVPEKTKPGKKVYRVVFDDKMNDVFQKPNKEGRITGYYPVSQEYGFFAKDGRYIPGFAFVRGALEKDAPTVESTIVNTMQKKIDAEIAKGGLKK